MSAASPTEKLRRGWIFLLLRWAAAFAILALLFHFSRWRSFAMHCRACH